MYQVGDLVYFLEKKSEPKQQMDYLCRKKKYVEGDEVQSDILKLFCFFKLHLTLNNFNLLNISSRAETRDASSFDVS
jgi:hypothetical protein